MRILLVIDRYSMFGIPNGGASQRNTLFVKALAQMGHVDVCSFSEEEIVSDIEDCDMLYSNPVPEEGNRFVKNAKQIIGITISPSNPYSYFNKNEKREKIVDELVKQGEYDIIACRYLHTAISCGLLKYKDKLVLDLDDNPSNKLKSMARNDKSVLSKAKHLYMSKRIPLMVEKTLEEVFCSFYSNIIEPPSPKSVYLHNTIVNPICIPDIQPTASNRILFIGSLNYPPNKYGVYHFVSNVFPLIKKSVHNVEFLIVGSGKKSVLDELNNMGGGIKALGFVEDLAAEYKEAKVVAIPIYQGSGSCVKFVEGMFMNRTMVSTPVGARDFDRFAKDGEHFLLAKNDEDFAEKIVELLLDTEKSNNIANNALALAKTKFSEEQFMEIVKNAIRVPQ